MLPSPRKIILDLITQYLAEPHPNQIKISHMATCKVEGWVDDNYWVEFRMLTRAEKELEERKTEAQKDKKPGAKPFGKIHKGA